MLERASGSPASQPAGQTRALGHRIASKRRRQGRGKNSTPPILGHTKRLAGELMVRRAAGRRVPRPRAGRSPARSRGQPAHGGRARPRPRRRREAVTRIALRACVRASERADERRSDNQFILDGGRRADKWTYRCA